MTRTIHLTYDDWKMDSDFDDNEPKKVKSQCDCCAKMRVLTQVWYLGMETWACDECRGLEADDD